MSIFNDKALKGVAEAAAKIMAETSHGTHPKTPKEKSLAALAHPKDKITHKDVLVGRGVLKKEETEQLQEYESKDGKYTHKGTYGREKGAKYGESDYSKGGEEEKEAAKIARDYVSNLLLNKVVRLENIESEKYGRILADVFIGDIHLNELLIKERYAVKYDGGTKKKPESWSKYKLTGSIL